MLFRLLRATDQSRVQSRVASLIDRGPFGLRIERLGIPVLALGMSRKRPNPLAIGQLVRWLREDPPDVVQTWMYHAGLLGSLAAKFAVREVPIAWNLRHWKLLEHDSQRTRLTIKLSGLLSARIPTRIITNSEAACTSHVQEGFQADRIRVIPNGIDLSLFQIPSEAKRLHVRRELGIATDALVVGIVGRFHPDKDYRNFVEAAGRVARALPDACFLLCGTDITADNVDLVGWIRAAGIESRCQLLGHRNDVPQLMSSFDLAVSSSCSESFPNVVMEAMACGVPCVVTDVGDSARMVESSGRVAPARNAPALADKILEMLSLTAVERSALGEAARQRVSSHYELSKIAAQYEATWREMIKERRG